MVCLGETELKNSAASPTMLDGIVLIVKILFLKSYSWSLSVSKGVGIPLSLAIPDDSFCSR